MFDLFSSATDITDMFQQKYVKESDFDWIVGIFAGNGALEAIQRALDFQLQSYYPYRMNKNSELVPLWRNYLFLEFSPKLSVQICRNTHKFIKIISDKDGPVLVRHDAINENLKLLRLGRFNDYIGRKSIVYRGTSARIISEDYFNGKFVKILIDIKPSWANSKKIPVEAPSGWSGVIELSKLALI